MNVWDKLQRSRVVEGLAVQMASEQVAHVVAPRPERLGQSRSRTLHGGRSQLHPGARRRLRHLLDLRPGYAQATSRRSPHNSGGPLIPVDTIRETVIPEASRSPFEGRNKVFIIEEAERMNPAAQNSLLKTLEIPSRRPFSSWFRITRKKCSRPSSPVLRVVRLDPVPSKGSSNCFSKMAWRRAAFLTARLSGVISTGPGSWPRTIPFSLAGVSGLVSRPVWSPRSTRWTSPARSLSRRRALWRREKAQRQEAAELAEAQGETRGTGAARATLAKRHKRELRRLEEEVLGEALSTIGSFYKDVVAPGGGGGDSVTNIDLVPELEAWLLTNISDLHLLGAIERCVWARSTLVKNANVPLRSSQLW